MVGNLGGERVVGPRPALGLAATLLGLPRLAALLGPGLPGGPGADLDRIGGDLPTARVLGQFLELVGGLVDRLEVALVLDLAAGRGQVRVPDLGLTAPGELYGALVEGRVELQQLSALLDVQDCGLEVLRIVAGPGPSRPSGGLYRDRRWRPSTSSPCTG
ncbi:MAG: hypothetical protein ACKOTA_04385 [Solirubrobacterales bacterium]